MIRVAGLVLTGLLAISPRPLPGQDAEAGVKPPTESRLPGDAADDSSGDRAWRAHGFTAEQRTSLREPFSWGIENRFIPGGALLIRHRGETIFREGFGVADLETKKPFAPEAPCRIASVTKPHTAMLIAMLVEEGKLAWDDPVDKYLPQFAKVSVRGKGVASRPPKVRELLSHTAGFPGNDERRAARGESKTDGTLAGVVDALARAGLAAEPGSTYAYSGFGYMVAGRIAEVVTGQEFGALMSERLLKPIGASTAVFLPAAPASLRAQMPTMYERQDGQLVKTRAAAAGEEAMKFPNPGGGLVSTLDDVGRLLLLHRNRGVVAGKQFIAAESLQALYRPQPGTKRAGYGLGFNIEHTDATGVGDRLRHGGASGTLALLDLRQDLIVVAFTQVPTKQTQPFGDRLMQAINAVFPSR